MIVRRAFAALPLCVLALAACTGSSPTEPPPAAPEPAPMAEPQPESATYEVTFQATWSPRTHPIDYPQNSHFSPLIGGTHDARVRFWADGALASSGIENMAERGRTSPLDSEVEAAIADGTADQVLRGDGLAHSPGATSIQLTVHRSHSLVTLVTMVAPSPDWFVGVSALDLFAGGRWVDELSVALVPWDAGTDDGRSFKSADAEARPHQPISTIDRAPLAPSGVAEPMGTFTFRRMATDG